MLQSVPWLFRLPETLFVVAKCLELYKICAEITQQQSYSICLWRDSRGAEGAETFVSRRNSVMIRDKTFFKLVTGYWKKIWGYRSQMWQRHEKNDVSLRDLKVSSHNIFQMCIDVSNGWSIFRNVLYLSVWERLQPCFEKCITLSDECYIYLDQTYRVHQIWTIKVVHYSPASHASFLEFKEGNWHWIISTFCILEFSNWCHLCL